MISVIIPVYNVEKYIKECLDSVINQSYKDLEIILVDDGSTDRSGIICDEYAFKDNRIKVIHKENGGLSSARNIGMKIATGEFFTFIDSDDYIATSMIEELYNALIDTSADLSICNISRKSYFEKNIVKNIIVHKKEKTLMLLLKEKQIQTSACAKLYKKCLFDDIYYPDGKLYEDFGTTYKLIHRAQRIAHINTPMYYYRFNEVSITKSRFTNKHLDYFDISEELCFFIEKEYPKLLQLAKNHSTRNAIAFMRRISSSNFSDQQTIRFLVKEVKKNILKYIFSCFSPLSKLYGILICLSPQIALKLFRDRM